MTKMTTGGHPDMKLINPGAAAVDIVHSNGLFPAPRSIGASRPFDGQRAHRAAALRPFGYAGYASSACRAFGKKR